MTPLGTPFLLRRHEAPLVHHAFKMHHAFKVLHAFKVHHAFVERGRGAGGGRALDEESEAAVGLAAGVEPRPCERDAACPVSTG